MLSICRTRNMAGKQTRFFRSKSCQPQVQNMEYSYTRSKSYYEREETKNYDKSFKEAYATLTKDMFLSDDNEIFTDDMNNAPAGGKHILRETFQNLKSRFASRFGRNMSDGDIAPNARKLKVNYFNSAEEFYKKVKKGKIDIEKRLKISRNFSNEMQVHPFKDGKFSAEIALSAFHDDDDLTIDVSGYRLIINREPSMRNLTKEEIKAKFDMNCQPSVVPCGVIDIPIFVDPMSIVLSTDAYDVLHINGYMKGILRAKLQPESTRRKSCVFHFDTKRENIFEDDVLPEARKRSYSDTAQLTPSSSKMEEIRRKLSDRRQQSQDGCEALADKRNRNRKLSRKVSSNSFSEAILEEAHKMAAEENTAPGLTAKCKEEEKIRKAPLSGLLCAKLMNQAGHDYTPEFRKKQTEDFEVDGTNDVFGEDGKGCKKNNDFNISCSFADSINCFVGQDSPALHMSNDENRPAYRSRASSDTFNMKRPTHLKHTQQWVKSDADGTENHKGMKRRSGLDAFKWGNTLTRKLQKSDDLQFKVENDVSLSPHVRKRSSSDPFKQKPSKIQEMKNTQKEESVAISDQKERKKSVTDYVYDFAKSAKDQIQAYHHSMIKHEENSVARPEETTEEMKTRRMTNTIDLFNSVDRTLKSVHEQLKDCAIGEKVKMSRPERKSFSSLFDGGAIPRKVTIGQQMSTRNIVNMVSERKRDLSRKTALIKTLSSAL